VDGVFGRKNRATGVPRPGSPYV